ncbi:MAG: DUF1772 domain-containing protein [Rhizobiaceae bacterium]|nr:DUF1772 domain-containing protein [Rhizobiaceae bacterium]MCV0408118.1 DUF1772 domain-containing protein [Rhizobiaceae bacterium]
MTRTVDIVALLLVAIAMALSLAHALELPGKMRLGKEAYMAVQPIYYPGFTFGGLVGEFGGMLALAALVLLAPFGTARFWWVAAALGLLVAAHLTYWVWTHPVNSFWLKDVNPSGAGGMFFSLFSRDAGGDWQALRNMWEYSHVARAALMMTSFLALAAAVTVRA